MRLNSPSSKPYIFISNTSPENPSQLLSSVTKPFFNLPFPPNFSLEDLNSTSKKNLTTGKIPTKTSNAFILYRRAFVKAAKMEGYKLPMTVISTMASQSWRLEPVYVKEEYKRIAKELRNINSQNISSNKGVKESRSLKNNQKKQDKSGLKRNQILTLSKNFESELCEKETLKFSSNPILLTQPINNQFEHENFLFSNKSSSSIDNSSFNVFTPAATTTTTTTTTTTPSLNEFSGISYSNFSPQIFPNIESIEEKGKNLTTSVEKPPIIIYNHKSLSDLLKLQLNFNGELEKSSNQGNFLSSKTLEKIKYINLLTAEQGKNKKLKETSDNVKRINHEFGSRMVEIADISFKNNLRRRAEIANYGYCDNQNEIGKAVKDQDIVADIWEESIKKKELVVYFRGAKLSKEQWINRPFNVSSTNIVTRQPLNSMVDSIWLKHVQLMIPLLNGKLKKLTNQPESIDFVGHGIGGVYAVLAALYFKHVGLVECFPSYRRFKPIIIGIYTFGTPRFGNLDLVRLVNASFQKKKIVRVTQQNDWVSRDFSPKGWFLHYESEYWVGYAKDDCGCIIIPKRETLYRCLGRGPRGQIDENVECNLGTVDDDNIKELNQRSYFGIDFGKC